MSPLAERIIDFVSEVFWRLSWKLDRIVDRLKKRRRHPAPKSAKWPNRAPRTSFVPEKRDPKTLN